LGSDGLRSEGSPRPTADRAACPTPVGELGIGVSEAVEQALRQAIARVREQRWLEENRATLESPNKYIEEKGLPLAHHRPF
jgi:post-segregation antitoxin (ccd killing protein)